MYYNVDVSPDEEKRLIEETAQLIHSYGMEAAFILFLESSKPLVWIGGEMGRAFISPFVPIISDKWGERSERFLLTFEKRENVDMLLKRLEELAQENKKKDKSDSQKKETEKVSTLDSITPNENDQASLGVRKKDKGWRKYLHF